MEFPRMVYRFPGVERDAEPLQDGVYDTKVVPNIAALDSARASGWALTPAEARAAATTRHDEPSIDGDTPPTRAELEQKATELGLRFDGRNSDKRLAEMIDAALRVAP